jgi:hypothetical protein
MFDVSGGDDLTYRQSGSDSMSWYFSLALAHKEDAAP